jgi:YbbR domain-containing protein
LNVPVKNDSDDSYERTYTVPETIVIKGSKDLINKTGSLTAKEIDVSYLYEDTEIPLEYELPEGVYVAKGYEGYVLNVKVTEKAKEDTEDNGENSEG